MFVYIIQGSRYLPFTIENLKYAHLKMPRQLSELGEANTNLLYLSNIFIIAMDHIYEDIIKLQTVAIKKAVPTM